jgi:hypothetical protein
MRWKASDHEVEDSNKSQGKTGPEVDGAPVVEEKDADEY